MRRDAQNHILSLRAGNVEYSFDVDAAGNVTAWQSAPLLTLSLLASNAVVLSIPHMASNYCLQWKPDLSGGSNWTTVATVPPATDDLVLVTAWISTSSGFFRLYKP